MTAILTRTVIPLIILSLVLTFTTWFALESGVISNGRKLDRILASMGLSGLRKRYVAILVFVGILKFADQLRTKWGYAQMALAVTSDLALNGLNMWDHCTTQQGQPVNAGTCAVSVIGSTAALGLSASTAYSTYPWFKRETVDYNATQHIANGTDILRSMKVLGLTSHGVSDTRFIRIESSGNFTRRDAGLHLFDMNYLGFDTTVVLPDSDSHSDVFVMYDESTNDTPLRVVTLESSGLVHVAPAAVLTAGGLARRNGYNGYQTTFGGGYKLLVRNANAIASWDDALNWFNIKYDSYQNPNELMWNLQLDRRAWGLSSLNGCLVNQHFQVIPEAYPFGTNWEDDLDWCWGGCPTGCPGNWQDSCVWYEAGGMEMPYLEVGSPAGCPVLQY